MKNKPENQILLTQTDVEELVSMKDCVEAVEDAFAKYARGEAKMPPKVYLELENGDLRAMPAYLGYAGVKWVNSHPENRKIGLPTVMAVLILNDPSTGFPLAIMDATHITNLRTGAAGGVAAKHLARKDSSVLGFVGCGTQAFYQLDAIAEIFDVSKVRCYDISREAEKRFSEYCKRKGFDCVVERIEKVCRSDILVTTTPSRKAIVMDEWVEEGTHINAIGADAAGKQELDTRILKRAKIVVDDLQQAIHGGEINRAIAEGVISVEDIFATLGEVVTGKKPGRESEEEITIFDSTGLAIQDIAVAKVVYERAKKEGKGLKLQLFRL